jgi:hypothetical protein
MNTVNCHTFVPLLFDTQTGKVVMSDPPRERQVLRPSVFLFQKCIDLCDQLVGIGAVNEASVCNGLTAGGGAAQAVHTDLKEEDGGIGSGVKNVADNRILGYLHVKSSFLFAGRSLQGMKYNALIFHLYYIAKRCPCQAKRHNFLYFQRWKKHFEKNEKNFKKGVDKSKML